MWQNQEILNSALFYLSNLFKPCLPSTEFLMKDCRSRIQTEGCGVTRTFPNKWLQVRMQLKKKNIHTFSSQEQLIHIPPTPQTEVHILILHLLTTSYFDTCTLVALFQVWGRDRKMLKALQWWKDVVKRSMQRVCKDTDKGQLAELGKPWDTARQKTVEWQETEKI